MTSKPDDVKRKRDELRRGGIGRRLSVAGNQCPAPEPARTGYWQDQSEPLWSARPRYEYLTHSHD
jgi:hypothetical protein